MCIHIGLNAVTDFLIRLPTKAGEEVIDFGMAEQSPPSPFRRCPMPPPGHQRCSLAAVSAGPGCAKASEAPPKSITPGTITAIAPLREHVLTPTSGTPHSVVGRPFGPASSITSEPRTVESDNSAPPDCVRSPTTPPPRCRRRSTPLAKPPTKSKGISARLAPWLLTKNDHHRHWQTLGLPGTDL